MNRQTIHVWVEEPRVIANQIQLLARIEYPGGPVMPLWYRVPEEFRDDLNPRADTFLVASLFTAMQSGHDMVVHGEVSSSLLRNAEEFQAAWATWSPHLYHQISVSADAESNQRLSSRTDSAVFAFSGGVDSMFTLFRHTHQLAGRRSRKLGAAVFVHGFDIALPYQATFESLCTRTRGLLNQFDIKLIPISTNFQSLEGAWDDAFGAGLASCLLLFARGYSAGLIASSYAYDMLQLPCGSNPIIDHLLSSDDFAVVHDGAEYTKEGKVEVIGNWDLARENLRVCFEGRTGDGNCCKCAKCIRTILVFRILGFGLPPCFSQDVTDEQIISYPEMSDDIRLLFTRSLEMARARDINQSWVAAIETAISAPTDLEDKTQGLRRVYEVERARAGKAEALYEARGQWITEQEHMIQSLHSDYEAEHARAEKAEALYEARGQWITELDAARIWNDEQRQFWQQRAGDLERELTSFTTRHSIRWYRSIRRRVGAARDRLRMH